MSRLAATIVVGVFVGSVGCTGCFFASLLGAFTSSEDGIPARAQANLGLDLASCDAFDAVYYTQSGLHERRHEVAFSVRGAPDACFEGGSMQTPDSLERLVL